MSAKRILFYFQPNSNWFRASLGAMHDEREEPVAGSNCSHKKSLDFPNSPHVTPVAGLNLLTEKFSRFSELSSEFEFWGSFSSNVKVNPVFSWKGQNFFQRIFPPYSQHFTTPQISFEFSGFYYTSNSFPIKPINTNDRKTCPFREILSQRIGRGEDWVE